MNQRLLKITLAFVLLVNSINIPQVHAAPNFLTDYHITYTALENELTRAALTVTLTNTTTEFYAASYQMQLGFTDVTNLTATDPEGPIKPRITKTNEGYMLDLTFNKKAVGKGDQLKFMITFDTKEVAKKHGNIWELNIPGIANPEEFKTFVVDVRVPPSFGKPTYIKPHVSNKEVLTFTKEQLGNSGISIAFGETQLYAYQVEYHLKNKNLFPITSVIALPPTTNYQDVYITGMDPTPQNVKLDKDGNWIAEYRLLPTEKMDIDVRGNVAVHLTPKTGELALEDYPLYTQAMPFWETTDPMIQSRAKELQTPQAIYDYVIKTLKYDFTRITQNTARMGAVEALRSKDAAVCREFTDLFIAIARAAGIPAREVNGFAYTENPRQRPISVSQDILHAWPEYYDKDKKAWIMVDPTWGSTTGGIDYFSKLDNDHVAFVIKGVDSKTPLPAGAYKIDSGSGLKDVTVGFAEEIIHAEPEVAITPNFPNTVAAGFPINGSVMVKNTGSSMVPSQLFTVISSELTPNDQVYQFPPIPPFGFVEIPVTFKAASFLTNTDAAITIHYNPNPGEQTDGTSVLGASTTDSDSSVSEQKIKVAPLYMTGWGIGGIIAILAGIIFITAAKSRRLPFFKQR